MNGTENRTIHEIVEEANMCRRFEQRADYKELEQEKREAGRYKQYNILSNTYMIRRLTAQAQQYCPPSHSNISLMDSGKEAC